MNDTVNCITKDDVSAFADIMSDVYFHQTWEALKKKKLWIENEWGTEPTNFDVRITRGLAILLLAACAEPNGVNIMCAEYGEDDDWVGMDTTDVEILADDDDIYQTFEVSFEEVD